jgi:hypothetical protein
MINEIHDLKIINIVSVAIGQNELLYHGAKLIKQKQKGEL